MNLRQKKSFATIFLNGAKRELNHNNKVIEATKKNLKSRGRKLFKGIGYHTKTDLNFIVRETRILEKKVEILEEYRKLLDIKVEFESKTFGIMDLLKLGG